MKTLKLAAAAVVCVLFFSHAAAAAPLTLTLQRTSVLYNEDPPGAPLPLGRTQYDAGDIKLNGQKIGEYLSVKDVHDNTLNVASLTITLADPQFLEKLVVENTPLSFGFEEATTSRPSPGLRCRWDRAS